MSPGLWNEVARELNSITQLSRDSANSEKIARHVEHVRLLVRGENVTRVTNPKLTRFDAHDEPDAATLEHIYHRNHPKRRSTKRHLPGCVLACRKCNAERGAPEARVFEACPVILAERGRKAA